VCSPVSLQQQTETDRIVTARERYVARGISTTDLVVARAEGARIWDVEGREYVDFAGGIACQNTGHGFPAAVAAIHEQVDRYLHQCFMVGLYEPYVEVCRRLAELSPCAGEAQRSLLVNSGAEAVENAVKIARAATGRPGVVVFDNSFHGRTLLTMTMTGNVKYKHGFGPFAPEVYRTPAPYPYRGITSTDAIAGLENLFKTDVAPDNVACMVLEPVQGEGGFIPMPPDFPAKLSELCAQHGILYVDDEVQSGVGRTGPVWAIEHYMSRDAPAQPARPYRAGSVEPTPARVEPDLLVSGKSLGGGLPLAGVTGRAEVMDAVAPGGLGGTFGGNPVSCAAALAVLDEVATPGFRERGEEVGRVVRERLEQVASRLDSVGEVRGLGPMLALEFAEPTPTRAAATTRGARERGLLLLSCGVYGNVVRVLAPILVGDEELERGLDILEESLVDADRAGA
jgi:4-aminobutyrate aminotransferase / (S)-3-amino-2-methylpropionate transaminase / 5-aminovalerate transaminase